MNAKGGKKRMINVKNNGNVMKPIAKRIGKKKRNCWKKNGNVNGNDAMNRNVNGVKRLMMNVILNVVKNRIDYVRKRRKNVTINVNVNVKIKMNAIDDTNNWPKKWMTN